MPNFDTMDEFGREEEWEDENNDAVELNESELEAVESELSQIEEVVANMWGEDNDETISDIETHIQEVDGIFNDHPHYSPLLEDRKRAESKILQGGSEAERQEGLEELMEWIERTRELL